MIERPLALDGARHDGGPCLAEPNGCAVRGVAVERGKVECCHGVQARERRALSPRHARKVKSNTSRYHIFRSVNIAKWVIAASCKHDDAFVLQLTCLTTHTNQQCGYGVPVIFF